LRYDVYRADRPAGGTFGAPTNMSASITASVAGANVAMDASDNTLIEWVQGNGVSDSTYVAPRVQSSFRPAGGAIEPPLTLYSTPGGSCPGCTQSDQSFVEGLIGDIAVTFDGQGHALIAWDGSPQSSNQDRFSHEVRATVYYVDDDVYDSSHVVAGE